MTTLVVEPEVVASLGAGWGALAEATLGILYEYEETAVVPVTPKPRPRPKTSPAPSIVFGGGTAWQPTYPAWSPEFAITEAGLEDLACRVAAFAESPELRTWTSAVLSREGRRGADLSTDKALASAVLTAVQEASFPLLFDPTTKALYLAAGLAALGLPTAVVAHGEITLTRALAAVEASGRWWYADPNGSLPLGHRAPFVHERVRRVPAVTERDDELGQLRAKLEAQAREIRELEERLAVLEAALETAKQLPLSREVATAPNRERLYKYVAVGALGLLAVTVFALVRSRAARPDTGPRRRRRSGAPRRRQRRRLT